jgi:hypothetical protein
VSGPYAVSVDPEEVIVVTDASSHGDAAVQALRESHARGWSAHPSRVVVYVTDGSTDERIEVTIEWMPSFSPAVTPAPVPDGRVAPIRCALRAIDAVTR